MMYGKKRKRIQEYQNALMEQHYTEVENIYSIMRRWKHNWHNQIQVLSAYLESGEYDRAKTYLEDIHQAIQQIDTVVKTGNTLVDAVLNSKVSLMKSHKIIVEIDVKVPATLSIPDVDLCFIIGNLLDNAMEACVSLSSETRFVHIYIRVKGLQLYMSFTNSAGKKQEKVGNIFISTKGKSHGLGLASVDALVKKNGGYLTRASEDGGYTTEVILPI